ncbi:MAG: phosphoribosylanthranilate isomerase [Chloroflexi bacterium]|nr:phosphoribosylanthranilate isomerase [Chloroflexota bacterium]
MMIQVKICGITVLEDARICAEAGADLIGLNFYRKSPRTIELDAARALCAALRSEFGSRCPVLVGLFVNEVVGRISMTMDKVGLDYAQLSGDESVDMLRELRGIAYKSIRPRSHGEALDDARYFSPGAPTDVRIPSLLVDAFNPQLYGGTGSQAPAEVALAVKVETPRLMLAGGLTPENVAERCAAIGPWGVDVASGVEGDTPGRKDAEKVRAFIAAAKKQEKSTTTTG